MILTNSQRMIGQATSGKWILCVAGAIVFIVCSVNGILPADDIKFILGILFTFYFTKPNENGKPTNGDV